MPFPLASAFRKAATFWYSLPAKQTGSTFITGPGGKLHANFNLNKDGEYLALVQPDGITIASQFAPALHPPQTTDVSYGWSQRFDDFRFFHGSHAGKRQHKQSSCGSEPPSGYQRDHVSPGIRRVGRKPVTSRKIRRKNTSSFTTGDLLPWMSAAGNSHRA